MKRRKILISLLCAVILFGTTLGFVVNTQASGSGTEAEEPVIEWYIPQTVKVGYVVEKNETAPRLNIAGEAGNLSAGMEINVPAKEEYGYKSHAGEEPFIVGEDGKSKLPTDYEIFYRPGVISLQIKAWMQDGSTEMLGEPYNVTVEEPVIETNAPQQVESGQTIELTTALTNTALTDEPVAPYLDPDNYLGGFFDEELLFGTYAPDGWVSNSDSHVMAYLPKVEITEGAELVERFDADYTNILSSRETLKFTGVGTVTLKITYQQIGTCDCMTARQFDENDNVIGIRHDYRYSPTKTVTINVTEPEVPVSVTDGDTGISLDAESGILPADTTLQIEKTAGDKYAVVSKALNDKAEKFEAFDIYLLSKGNEVQPDGKVKITMPVPSGYYTERLAVYNISDDGNLTEMKFTLSADDKTVSFETDHFSIYAIAELISENTPDEGDGEAGQTGNEGENTPDKDVGEAGQTDNEESIMPDKDDTSTSPSDEGQDGNNEKPSDEPQTGDSSMILLTCFALLASGISLCAVAYSGRRRKN